MAVLALLLRTAYDYFLPYADVPWVQFWWSIIFYNAWFMVVCDDPFVWFYYNWGVSALPMVVLIAGGPSKVASPQAGASSVSPRF